MVSCNQAPASVEDGGCLAQRPALYSGGQGMEIQHLQNGEGKKKKKMGGLSKNKA